MPYNADPYGYGKPILTPEEQAALDAANAAVVTGAGGGAYQAAPVPPPPADTSMYAAPIEAQYQPGGTSYVPPPEAAYSYGEPTTAHIQAYAPPTDPYNTAPSGTYGSDPIPAPAANSGQITTTAYGGDPVGPDFGSAWMGQGGASGIQAASDREQHPATAAAVSPAGVGDYRMLSPNLPFTDPRSFDSSAWENARRVQDTQRQQAAIPAPLTRPGPSPWVPQRQENGEALLMGSPTLDWVQGVRDAGHAAADRILLPVMQDAARAAMGDAGYRGIPNYRIPAALPSRNGNPNTPSGSAMYGAGGVDAYNSGYPVAAGTQAMGFDPAPTAVPAPVPYRGIPNSRIAPRQSSGAIPNPFDWLGEQAAITRDELGEGAAALIGAITGEDHGGDVGRALGVGQGGGGLPAAATTIPPPIQPGAYAPSTNPQTPADWEGATTRSLQLMKGYSPEDWASGTRRVPVEVNGVRQKLIESATVPGLYVGYVDADGNIVPVGSDVPPEQFVELVIANAAEAPADWGDVTEPTVVTDSATAKAANAEKVAATGTSDSTASAGDSGSSGGGGSGWIDYGDDWSGSSGGRSSSSWQDYGDDFDYGREFTADDFLEAADGDRKKATMMARFANRKRRSRRSRSEAEDGGGFWPGFPFNRPPSPIRQNILAALQESMAASRGGQTAGRTRR